MARRGAAGKVAEVERFLRQSRALPGPGSPAIYARLINGKSGSVALTESQPERSLRNLRRYRKLLGPSESK